jgi:hypothetical protein
MSATLVHIINALSEELNILGNNIEYDVRQKLEGLKEQLDAIDLSTNSSLDTNMTCALQDAGIDGTVRREGHKLIVYTKIFYTYEEFVFIHDESGLWFLTRAYITRRETKDSPVKSYIHKDLHIGGYTDEQMLDFATNVLTAGNNVSTNRFFGVKLY